VTAACGDVAGLEPTVETKFDSLTVFPLTRSYPVKLIVQPLTGVHEVGLLKVAGTFESVERAPTGTYESDEALTVNVGEVVVIEARRNRASDVCAFALSPNIYSKLVVDSVSAGTNAIWFRFVANPNCGFRSFAAGLPKN